MTPVRHHDIHIEQLDDGTLRLTQVDYSGNDAIIDLHPDQLRSIAAQVVPIQTTSTQADVVLRRFKAVVQAVRDAAWNESTFNDIWERAAEAQTLYTGLNAAMAMADEFIEDCESVTVTRQVMSREVTNCHDKSDGFSVTGSKRGRPATGQAMTDAERQAKHRANATAELLEEVNHG